MNDPEMNHPYEKLHKALETLGLPTHVTLREITQRYRELAAKHHPDRMGDEVAMAHINEAYELLRRYIEQYRFSFSEEEIARQFPRQTYVKQFRF